jgi:hypothetical protein
MEPNQMPIQPIALPIQPTIEPIQASAEQNFEPTKKSLPKWPLIIVGVILLATLLTGAYLLIKSQNTKIACTTEAKLCPDESAVGRTGPKCEFTPCPKMPTPTLAPKATGSGTLIATETANWKTYIDSKDFYSFKYPEAWFMNGDNSSNVHNSVGISPIKLQGVDQAFSNMIAFNILDNPNNLPIEDYVKANISPQTVNYSTQTIAGIQGKRTADLPGQFSNDEVFVEYKNKIYTITLIKSPGEQIPSSTFNQIMSSFKFTQ